MISEKISAVQWAVISFGLTASVASNDVIIVRNRKGVVCASVSDSGVEQKYQGGKNLCGALVRNAIVSALAQGGGK